MTTQIFVISPEYNSFYVTGSQTVNPPLDFKYNGIAADSHCVTVPTTYYAEGATEVIVTQNAELMPRSEPAYEGLLDTPRRLITIYETNSDIAEFVVTGTSTRLRIWIDHPSEPDHVVIAWSDASTE